MTDNIEWGEPIAVDGVRPDWLSNGEPIAYYAKDFWHGLNGVQFCPEDAHNGGGWHRVSCIRLPASHEFYTVQRYNKEHGTSFTYWPGGDAPADWDGGKVLYRDVTDRDIFSVDWKSALGETLCGTDIIGYTRRTEQPAADAVTIARMTEEEWERKFDLHGHMGFVRYLGLVKPDPTTAERIATDTGLDLTTVERVLAAQEKLNA